MINFNTYCLSLFFLLFLIHNCKPRNFTKLIKAKVPGIDPDPIRPIDAGTHFNMTKFLSDILSKAKTMEKLKKKKKPTTTPKPEPNPEVLALDNLYNIENKEIKLDEFLGSNSPVMRHDEPDGLMYDIEEDEGLRMSL